MSRIGVSDHAPDSQPTEVVSGWQLKSPKVSRSGMPWERRRTPAIHSESIEITTSEI